MPFTTHEVMPGVFHIQDAMGVSMTLLCGTERALLVDTGYGLEDVAAHIRSLTDLPLTVALTHGHHDHALGCRWFDRVLLLPEELPTWQTYTGERWRRHVLRGAADKGLAVDEERFLRDTMPEPDLITEPCFRLGGLTAEIIPCPGHTPGSLVVFVPERGLLLTGDDWNPCTWLFFPEALPVAAYRTHVRGLLRLPFTHILCSHRERLYPRRMLEVFLDGLTDEALRLAQPSGEGEAVGVRTRTARLPEDQVLVFDADKAEVSYADCR